MVERGSTLLEMLVALAVLGLGVSGCARLLLLGLATESQGALREAAAQRLADAAELSWAWAGTPPAPRVTEWRTSAAALRPDTEGGVTADLQLQTAPGEWPLRLLASLRWGIATADTASLLSAVYATAPAPP
jgi:prepilin-type N-terminal cleavage/methylation domain-containing protein